MTLAVRVSQPLRVRGLILPFYTTLLFNGFLFIYQDVCHHRSLTLSLSLSPSLSFSLSLLLSSCKSTIVFQTLFQSSFFLFSLFLTFSISVLLSFNPYVIYLSRSLFVPFLIPHSFWVLFLTISNSLCSFFNPSVV